MIKRQIVMNKIGQWPLATLILLSTSAWVYAEEVLSINAAVAEVVETNPGLAAISARAEALAALPDQLGTLPDPQLTFKLMNLPVDSFSFSQEGMTQTQIGFSQMLPFPGKLGLRQEAAQDVDAPVYRGGREQIQRG